MSPNQDELDELIEGESAVSQNPIQETKKGIILKHQSSLEIQG